MISFDSLGVRPKTEEAVANFGWFYWVNMRNYWPIKMGAIINSGVQQRALGVCENMVSRAMMEAENLRTRSGAARHGSVVISIKNNGVYWG